MPKGPRGEKRPADVIGNAVYVMPGSKATRIALTSPRRVSSAATSPCGLHAPLLGFSKKFENHCHIVALYTVWYNFVKMHKTLKMTPAMGAGVSDKLWSVGDIVDLIEASERLEDGSLLVG
jgi:hypothetical protein